MLSAAQCGNEDSRSIYELCFCLFDGMEDIKNPRKVLSSRDSPLSIIFFYFGIFLIGIPGLPASLALYLKYNLQGYASCSHIFPKNRRLFLRQANSMLSSDVFVVFDFLPVMPLSYLPISLLLPLTVPHIQQCPHKTLLLF